MGESGTALGRGRAEHGPRYSPTALSPKKHVPGALEDRPVGGRDTLPIKSDAIRSTESSSPSLRSYVLKMIRHRRSGWSAGGIKRGVGGPRGRRGAWAKGG